MSQAGKQDDSMQTIFNKSAEKLTTAPTSDVPMSNEQLLGVLQRVAVSSENLPVTASPTNVIHMENAFSGEIPVAEIIREREAQKQLFYIRKGLTPKEVSVQNQPQSESNLADTQAFLEEPETVKAIDTDDLAAQIQARKADLRRISFEQQEKMRAFTPVQPEVVTPAAKTHGLPIINTLLKRFTPEDPSNIQAKRQKAKKQIAA